MDVQTETSTGRDVPKALYDQLEERVLARDQVGASQTYYGLLRAGRPLAEIVAAGVRIHAPYTHVPYHERIDDGYPNFVNNDHCLLSARATLNLARMLPGKLAHLPMAQTIWYIPTGLDIWNQKINKAPGHYTRMRGNLGKVEAPPAPVVYWPDQDPLRDTAPLHERLNNWFTLVHRGQVVDAYRMFLGVMENPANRKEVLAELVFAGMIDVQDRMLWNRSYTTGHKAYRARSTVEIGNAIGWDNAHHVLYAGALDIAVGPRWYSTYEMACNCVKMWIEGEALHAVPYGGVSEAELAVLRNTDAMNQEDSAALIEAIIRGEEPDALKLLTQLLQAGKDPRRIIDVIQIAAAQVVLETQKPEDFSMPHHCYEYLQHGGLVLRQFRAPAAAAAALCRDRVPEPRGGTPARDRRRAAGVDQAAARRQSADRRAVARSGRYRDLRAERGGEPGLDAGLSATMSPIADRWWSASRWPRASWATIRTTRKSPSAC